MGRDIREFIVMGRSLSNRFYKNIFIFFERIAQDSASFIDIAEKKNTRLQSWETIVRKTKMNGKKRLVRLDWDVNTGNTTTQLTRLDWDINTGKTRNYLERPRPFRERG